MVPHRRAESVCALILVLMPRASVPDVTAALAAPEELDDVHELLGAAGAALAARGFPNWLPEYARDRVQADIDQRVAWAVRDTHDALVATFMLRAEPVRPYVDIEWGDAQAVARYLNRLAVDPARQGQGIGRWCLAFIAQACRASGATAVRCDVLSANVPLRRFYERNGFVARGERYHSGWHFVVYERETTDDGR